MTENEKAKTAQKQTAARYTKASIMKSETYKKQRDLLNVILDEGRQYTKEDIRKLTEGYMKRGIK